MEESGSSDPDGSFRLSGVPAPERTVILNASDKQSVLNSLIELLAKAPQITSKAELAGGIFRREALMSTGIGLGIAIPSVRLASVTGMVMAAALVPGGISDYESLDGRPVRLVAMIAARLDQHAEYLRLLSCLSSELNADTFRAGLFRCTDDAELFRELISQDR